MALERQFHWHPPGSDEAYTVHMETDDADFDLDPVTGERYCRVLRFIINGTPQRDSDFTFRARGRLPMPQHLEGPHHNVIIPVRGRVTEEAMRWDFTPEHRAVMPGSISTPSLLTSGGGVAGTSTLTASIAPTANALLVVGFGTTHSADFTETVTYTTGPVSAITRRSADFDPGLGFSYASQSYLQMGASPGSGSIHNEYSSGTVDITRDAWIVAEITGHDTATPESENGTALRAGDATCTVTLGAIAAGNLAIGVVGTNSAGTITPGANETELAEATGGASLSIQMEYGTDNVVNWSTLGTQGAGVAIEYNVGPSALPSLMTLTGAGD